MLAHQIVLLLFIGYIVFSIDKKQKYFPVPMVLVLLGILLSFISYFDSLKITKEIIFNVFLPALLFTSAYQFSLDSLKKNKWIIATLTTVGLMATAGLLGVAIYFISGPFLQISFVGALLIAAILTPTDPVSVVSILKQSTGNEKIADIVEGESMVNDGTSIVIYSVLLTMYKSGESFSVGSFLGEFILVSAGGIILGIIFGWLLGRAVHYTHHKQYQVMLSIIVAYGSFHIAEKIGVSGVLATVTAGIMLSWEFGKSEKEDYFHDSLDGFWNIVEPSVLALIFLLIGIDAADYLAFPGWVLAFIIFVLSLVVRFLVLAGFTSAVPAWRKNFSAGDVGLITWSGIKGTMSVALLLGLEAGVDNDNVLVSLTFAAILLSLVIQSVGVYPLTKEKEQS
ncbi:cation:proton antiporter [Sediminibacillus halophilus]|uniref:Monovalent cation:H+ antiporter, CPA1 family n=1 Tax=Sediminibacillus halophilus TaxID=482461 RepID=A0A1G9N1R0_9BACI|nr:sodium:proton antiporter [Sediminibacillus halophilus]SDL80462.1 monovalent cation:H+ antiporter, CPA1 family [Sediminibacillus halophilus]